MTRRIAAALLVLGGCFAFGADTARACGDKFLVLGGSGVSRRYSSLNPSNILVVMGKVGNPDDYSRLAETLDRAGHDVKVINSPAALAAALTKEKYDAVLIEATDAKVAAPLVATAANQPLLIKLLCNETAAALAATQEGACLRTPEKATHVMGALDGYLGQRKAARRAVR